jgi:hypothetical protein
MRCSLLAFILLLFCKRRLQQYARDARKEYAELGSKDLSELKSFVKGLPKLLLLDRLSDLAVPVAEIVKEQVRLQAVSSSPSMRLSVVWLNMRRGIVCPLMHACLVPACT